jgi:cell division control protein 7
LFKVSQQTTALDIWSAGVILLSLLTKQFPFFNSTDDQDSIVELACLFGNQEMAQVAQRFSKCRVIV